LTIAFGIVANLLDLLDNLYSWKLNQLHILWIDRLFRLRPDAYCSEILATATAADYATLVKE
jgi:hypothetical protein